MSTKYYDYNGNEISIDEIKVSFSLGLATLIHANGDNTVITSLSLDYINIDTRNTMYSVWDEVWTEAPQSIDDCLDAARLIF